MFSSSNSLIFTRRYCYYATAVIWVVPELQCHFCCYMDYWQFPWHVNWTSWCFLRLFSILLVKSMNGPFSSLDFRFGISNFVENSCILHVKKFPRYTPRFNAVYIIHNDNTYVLKIYYDKIETLVQNYLG